ncbi:cellulase family glycosylhydrolase [Pseudoflavitalea rhizosphaerae]|uniref:cellulase family glycosylhydrolase n=1 Tax=Pseudoflavitalea rhizosphaerae TaxID=1884793 RepID=UPI000F8C6FFC|nr:cellulase family glycosylhydrolase [Pseudoflavitalea rhizosphaerae]
MKKFTLFFYGCVMLLLAGAYNAKAQTPVQQNGQLQVIGLKLCNQYGNPIQLRGMSTHGLQWYGLGDCITDASLDALANDWEADILRISLYVQEGGYDTDPAGFTQMVSTIIDKVTARGMYALVDWHQLTPGDPNANLTKAKTFFTAIANAHKNKNNILYDICNEPNNVSWSAIRNYANELIPVIRAIDADAPILIGTHGWASFGVSSGGSAQDILNNPVNHSNIMYTFHFYAASHGTSYLNELSWAADRMPVFVTEFGTQEASGDGGNNFTRSQQYLDLMRTKKISWCNWNYSDDSRSGAVWTSGTCSNGPWTVARLKPAGAWVRERIKSPADDFPGGGNPNPPCLPVSASADDGNVPANVLDNDLNTRWSASGDGQWISFCLGDTVAVSGVQIAFYNGNARSSLFDVQYSLDGSSWLNASTGLQSSGASTALETFSFTPVQAKWVRILGHGNTVNAWNSYTEVKLQQQQGNIAPTVSITSPANNAGFTAPASVVINATAADADGTVTKVEFFNGATKLGEATASPYSYTWNSVAAGNYVLTAKATDNSNAGTTSAAVNISVAAPPSCAPVTASADDGNVPANVLDDDLNTRWSASGDGQWIQFCLGTDPVSVTGVQIAFYNGNVRSSTFDVLVGNDGNTWTTAASGLVSSGSSTALETFSFTPVNGKYVRIVGHGNSINLWNSYTEVKIQTGSGSGGTFTLTPEADAYVRDGTNAAITYGTTDPTLLITKVAPSGQLNNARESYLRFDLSSVSGNVSSATLRVYGKVDLTTVPSVPIGIYAVANITWSESALTWNNKPASGAGLDTNTVTNTAYGYIAFDVTSYVQGELAASHNKVSFAMKSLTAHDPRVFWNSKEFGSNPPQLVVQTSTGQQAVAERPLAVELDAHTAERLKFAVFPNPFRGNSTITFHLHKASQTNLTVYDITGRRVAVLVNKVLNAGSHRVMFSPEANARGVYILRMDIDGKTITKKLVRE